MTMSSILGAKSALDPMLLCTRSANGAQGTDSPARSPSSSLREILPRDFMLSSPMAHLRERRAGSAGREERN